MSVMAAVHVYSRQWRVAVIPPLSSVSTREVQLCNGLTKLQNPATSSLTLRGLLIAAPFACRSNAMIAFVLHGRAVYACTGSQFVMSGRRGTVCAYKRLDHPLLIKGCLRQMDSQTHAANLLMTATSSRHEK
jgi:hypothetical protein